VRKRWAALIKQLYEADPLLCPKCGATMRIVSFIERDQSKLAPIPIMAGLLSGASFCRW
jgi:hypothetical protein